MVIFPIRFAYANSDYSASVQKVGSSSIQYLVSELDPRFPGLPDPLIFFADKDNEKITYAVEHDKYPAEFGNAVAAAILCECDVRLIDKFGS